MSKEGDVAAGSLRRSMLSAELYKPSQGRITRQATFSALAATILLGAWSLHRFLDVDVNKRYIIDAVIVVVGLWASFRLVNTPRFADFLISVEAEMNKVSWPSRTEMYRSAIVVLVTIFGLTFLLFGYDVAWQFLLEGLGVLKGAAATDLPA